jgi:hypothetical protein
MPLVPFGPQTISRLIVGGNQQNGAMHNHSKALSRHTLEYFTVDRTVEFLRKCLAQGINTWQANFSEKTGDVLLKLHETGEDINLIPLSSPGIGDFGNQRIGLMTERIENNWIQTLALKPIGIYIFGWTMDILWRQGKIDTARDFLKRIRQAGVQVGVCTHIPEVIEYVEEKGWDVDFYMASLYRWAKTREEILAIMPEVPHDGYEGWELYLPSELIKMCDTIRKTPKTCLAFKLLAGGRTCSTPEQVSKVFQNVLTHIKPKDAIVVGMYPCYTDEITENANLVKKYG